jgi:hypothetical protein
MYLPHRPGNLPNLTKTEFADLLLRYTDQALAMTGEGDVLEFDVDGRILHFYHTIFPASNGKPELREWSVQLWTLNQRTPRCCAKIHQRNAWLYLAPFHGEGYKPDPTGKWWYSVWR